MVYVTFLPRQRNVITESASAHAIGQTRQKLITVELAGPSGNVLEDATLVVDAVAIVSAKHFIATIPRESNSHVLACHLRNIICRQHRGIAEWLLQRTGQMRDRLYHVGLENHLVMIGVEFIGDDASVVRFVEIIFLEADGKSLDRARTGARHQGNDS